MDTVKKIKGSRIINIIRVSLDKTLLGLYFNIKKFNEELSIKLNIGDDGETIVFGTMQNWVSLKNFKFKSYSTVIVQNDDAELSKLIDTEILNVQFGVGKLLKTNQKVIYYFKMTTSKNEFLFFNNGDQGLYSFDRINIILDNDIYGYEWQSKPPFIILD